MPISGPTSKLQRCPACRSRRLVVAVYSAPGRPAASRTLECEGCCSVVLELPLKGSLERLVHPTVLERELTR